MRPLVLLCLFCLASQIQAGEWTVLRDCRYKDDPANDGDSFHVTHQGKEYIFRLYFVDCPETDYAFPERVEEQAKHFGISTNEVVKWGRTAAGDVKQMCHGQPLKITTQWHDARGRSHLPRYYAVVEVNGADLAKDLVVRGLARVHGVGADAPTTPAASFQWDHLRSLEKNAHEKKRGAWYLGGGFAYVDPSLAPDRPAKGRRGLFSYQTADGQRFRTPNPAVADALFATRATSLLTLAQCERLADKSERAKG